MTKTKTTAAEKWLARDAERRLRGDLRGLILGVLARAKGETTSAATICRKVGSEMAAVVVERMSDDGRLVRRYCRRGGVEVPWRKGHTLGGPFENRYKITPAGRRLEEQEG